MAISKRKPKQSGIILYKSTAAATSLLNVASEAPFSDDEKERVSAQAPQAKLLATVKEAASLVASKTPTEPATYRQLVVTVATKVAEAAKEGGFASDDEIPGDEQKMSRHGGIETSGAKRTPDEAPGGGVHDVPRQWLWP